MYNCMRICSNYFICFSSDITKTHNYNMEYAPSISFIDTDTLYSFTRTGLSSYHLFQPELSLKYLQLV